jgi:hypothetical protein
MLRFQVSQVLYELVVKLPGPGAYKALAYLDEAIDLDRFHNGARNDDDQGD